jgi:hypothetical protein
MQESSMKLMLTSFGISRHAVSATTQDRGLFDGMPPVSFARPGHTFMPDFDLLLLCDTLFMDEDSYLRLVNDPARPYARVAETFRELHKEGRIELANFNHILGVQSELLEQMLAQDLVAIDQWIEPLRESLALWARFVEHSSGAYEAWQDDEVHARGYYPMHITVDGREDVPDGAYYQARRVAEALKVSSKKRLQRHLDPLRETLRQYLAYVNANLVLANELQAGFHDWRDLNPFYEVKFLSVGKGTGPAEAQRQQLEKLFTIPFPELAIRDTRTLMKALNDRRITDLRQLISDAVAGKAEFDAAFAKSVLTKVLAAEMKATKWRNLVGYLTMPLGLLPVVGAVADKAAEEAVGALIDRKVRREYQWFYLLSEIAGRFA